MIVVNWDAHTVRRRPWNSSSSSSSSMNTAVTTTVRPPRSAVAPQPRTSAPRVDGEQQARLTHAHTADINRSCSRARFELHYCRDGLLHAPSSLLREYTRVRLGFRGDAEHESAVLSSEVVYHVTELLPSTEQIIHFADGRLQWKQVYNCAACSSSCIMHVWKQLLLLLLLL